MGKYNDIVTMQDMIDAQQQRQPHSNTVTPEQDEDQNSQTDGDMGSCCDDESPEEGDEDYNCEEEEESEGELSSTEDTSSQ